MGNEIPAFIIRPARSQEYGALGRLVAEAYASVPGMPSPEEQADYYALLRNVERRASNPAIRVFVAAGTSDELLGSVDFIEDMRQYGALGIASDIPDAAGIRLLAVNAECRGRGIGKALTRFCLERARVLGRSRVILHTTRPMVAAWAMYETLGFERLPRLDFQQGTLDVFGFQLRLERDRSPS